MGLIGRMVQRQVLALLLAGGLFLVFLPMFVLMMKPHHDLMYHLGDTELEKISAKDFATKARTNAFVQIKGAIDAETLAERRSLLDRSLGFLFAVEGYPRTLIVHLSGGELFQRLEMALASESEAALVAELTKKVVLRGRLYDGDNILEPFSEYAQKDEADPESYVWKILKDDIDTTPDIVNRLDGKDPDTRTWYLLAVDEEPRAGHLWETNLPVFGIGILFGLAALVALVVVLGRKPKRGPGYPPYSPPPG